MNSHFLEYLSALDLPQSTINRASEVHDFYSAISPEELIGIFLTDVVMENGSRDFDNLWFFSASFMMEAKRFMGQDDFDIAPYTGGVEYLQVRKEAYDFVKAGENSRLQIVFRLSSNVDATLRASRENCDFLKRILLEHILTHLAP